MWVFSVLLTFLLISSIVAHPHKKAGPKKKKPSPKATGCRDSNTYCAYWAKQGECQKNQKYMRTFCRLSCNLCKGACGDSNTNCAYWAKRGNCQKNPKYMGTFCKLSCNLCKNGKTVVKKTNPPVDGKYGEWSKWTKCSGSCGSGTKSRIRKCDKPAPKNNGTKCNGPNGQAVTCNDNCPLPDSCPINGRKYKKGERFVSLSCTGWCTCNGNGFSCVSLCPPYIVTCKSGEMKISFQKKVSNTPRCYCKRNKCVKRVSKKNLNDKECGKRIPSVSVAADTIPKKAPIVGGVPAGVEQVVGGYGVKTFGDWPWQVGLVKKINPGKIFCGGTLVNSRTVLTAAHCFPRTKNPKAADYKVRIGEVNLDVYEDSEEVVGVTKIFKHQDFSIRTYVNDIAILILEKDVTNKLVGAACVSVDKNDIGKMANKICSITGWGKLTEDGITARVLQQAKVPIVENRACKKAYSNQPGVSIKRGMFCAGLKEGGADSCQGDSGGPLVCKKTDGSYVLHGIVSWGIGCARNGTYGVYTKVSDFDDWITERLYSPK